MAAYTSGADWSFDGIPAPELQPQTSPLSSDAYSRVKPAPKPVETQDDAPQVNAGTGSAPPAQETEPSASSRSDARPSHDKTWPSRQCRICLEIVAPTVEMSELPLPASLQPKPRVMYISEEGGRLIRPCKCKGTQQYVHEDCLQQWRLADVSQKRNYFECPTCRYRYTLQRLTWASYISSTASQIALTLAILILTMFVLGFVADPIINIYLYDPVYTITTRGGPTGSLIFEDEAAGWAEHFGKGLVSLGLIGFAKLLFTVSPFQFFRGNFGGGGGRAGGGTGRDRINQATWLLILIGVVTFLIAVWKGVRAWARKTLEAAGERVLDVPGGTDDDADEYKEQ